MRMIFVKLLGVLSLVLTLTLLSGCFYPAEKRVDQVEDTSVYVAAVQEAVNAYYMDNRTWPILQSEKQEDSLYQVIDLRAVYPRYLQEYPANAFEQGGTMQYVLLEMDGKSIVRLVDLRFQTQLTETQTAVDRYRERTGSYPLGERINEDQYILDTESLRLDFKTIRSMFSTRDLSFIIDVDGTVSVDYLPDLVAFLELNPNDRIPNRDLSFVLAKHSFYAPISIQSYELINNQIQMTSRK